MTCEFAQRSATGKNFPLTSPLSSDYTSPVIFWTNIELSLAVISGCLPTLRPIWTYFHPPKSATATRSYGNASYCLNSSGKQKYRSSKQYSELDDLVTIGDSIAMGSVTVGTGSSGEDKNNDYNNDGRGIVIRRSIELSSVREVL